MDTSLGLKEAPLVFQATFFPRGRLNKSNFHYRRNPSNRLRRPSGSHLLLLTACNVLVRINKNATKKGSCGLASVEGHLKDSHERPSCRLPSAMVLAQVKSGTTSATMGIPLVECHDFERVLAKYPSTGQHRSLKLLEFGKWRPTKWHERPRWHLPSTMVLVQVKNGFTLAMLESPLLKYHELERILPHSLALGGIAA